MKIPIIQIVRVREAMYLVKLRHGGGVIIIELVCYITCNNNTAVICRGRSSEYSVAANHTVELCVIIKVGIISMKIPVIQIVRVQEAIYLVKLRHGGGVIIIELVLYNL